MSQIPIGWLVNVGFKTMGLFILFIPLTGFYDDRWYTKLAPLSMKSQVTSHNSHLASQADVVIDKSSEDWVPQQVSQTMWAMVNTHG